MKKIILLLTLLTASLFAEATFEQVQSMIEKQQYKQATLALTIIAENHPNSSKVFYTLAQAQAGLGDLVKARENLDKAMAINPRLDFVPAEQVVQLQKALQPQTKLITKVEEPSHWFRNLLIAIIAGFLAIFGYKKFFKKEEKPNVFTAPTGTSSKPSNSTSSTPPPAYSSKTTYGPTPSARNYYYEQASQSAAQPTPTVTEVHHHPHSDSGIRTVGAGVVGLVAGAAIAESLHDHSSSRASSSWVDTSYEEPRSTSSSSSSYSPSWDDSSSSSSSSRSWDDSSSSSSRSKSWDDNSSSSSSWSSSSDSGSSSSWD